MPHCSVKAISLTQPWATAIMRGLKTYETRSWETRYQGAIAIHAAKSMSSADRYFAEEQLGADIAKNLPLGCILGICRLHFVIPITNDFARQLTLSEDKWGDYSPGRFAWNLDHIRPFPKTYAIRGHLGLWTWNFTESWISDLIDEVLA